MAGEYSTILYDGGHPVATLTLNRPDKRNPIGPATLGEMVHALTAAQADSRVRVIVLTGAGKVFSAGGDLAQLSGQRGETADQAPPRSLVEFLTFMHELGKPVIAKVNGHALAGGLGLVVACDLAIASDEATFGTTEIRVGLWPMMISAEISRAVGRKVALDLMLTGRRVAASEAVAMGLVNRAVAAADLDRETQALAESIAAHSPATMALGLRSFYRSADMEWGPALAYLEGQLAQVLSLEDAREGLAAFLAKREPVWKGR